MRQKNKELKLTNLEKAINVLNAPYVYFDEVDRKDESIPSSFSFTYRVEDDRVFIFDRNEYYNIDYLENLNCENYSLAQEFGFKFTPKEEDEIHKQLEDAIKKDFGEDAYLEWEDSVVMLVAR